MPLWGPVAARDVCVRAAGEVLLRNGDNIVALGAEWLENIAMNDSVSPRSRSSYYTCGFDGRRWTAYLVERATEFACDAWAGPGV